MASQFHYGPGSEQGPSALALQNRLTLTLLLVAGLLAGVGIGTAFSRQPGAHYLVVAGAALGIGGALSSLLAGHLALRQVLALRRVPWGAVLAFCLLGAEAWYATFMLHL